MNHTAKIASHNKALEILELLDKAVKRLQRYQDTLNNYNKLSRTARLWSFYERPELEWGVKKGERSVSFISGMYERFMRREFVTPKWETLGYTMVIKPFELIDMTDGKIDVNRPYREVLKFPIVYDSVPNDSFRGLVEPVSITYEESNSPDSIGYQ